VFWHVLPGKCDVQKKINPHARVYRNRVFMKKHTNLAGGLLQNQINSLNAMQIIFPEINIEKIRFTCKTRQTQIWMSPRLWPLNIFLLFCNLHNLFVISKQNNNFFFKMQHLKKNCFYVFLPQKKGVVWFCRSHPQFCTEVIVDYHFHFSLNWPWSLALLNYRLSH